MSLEELDEEEPPPPGMLSVCPDLIALPLMLFALLSEATETPFFAAIPLSVSPDCTVYRDEEERELPPEDAVLEPRLDPGIVSTWPRCTTVPLRLFALCMEAMDTPCTCAIFPSVSPD